VQRPLIGFADGGAYGTGDHGFFHDLAPASAGVPPTIFVQVRILKGLRKPYFH
jgi:hypothetical protein